MPGGLLHTRGCPGGQTGWGLRSLVWANLVGMVVLWVLARPITTQQRLQHAWTCLVTLVGHARGLIAHQGLPWGPNWLTRQEITRKQSLRIHAYAAVLGYRYLYHDDAIADAYQEYSREFAREARELARQDEIEAWKVYNDAGGILAFCDQFLPR